MKISNHSLRQIDEAYINQLGEVEVRKLCVNLVDDLKDARERLGQTSHNSSRPPSSDGPFGKKEKSAAEGAPAAQSEPEAGTGEQVAGVAPAAPSPSPKPVEPGKPGKPLGAPGFGRSQLLPVDITVEHYPGHCAGCGQDLSAVAGQIYTSFQQIDVLAAHETGKLGLQVQVTEHRYGAKTCTCGHTTQERWQRGEVCPLLKGVALSEWRLIGPGLATLIVGLHQRYRISYGRIQEFLDDWLGLRFSRGVLSACVSEAGAAIAPAEEELVQAVLASELLHIDETPWYEGGRLLWLWVFVAPMTVLYYVAGRGRELLDNLLSGFSGYVMSDGLPVYRHFIQRLRCWAHLLRKAQELSESCDANAQQFGSEIQQVLETLIDAVYQAREGPPAVPLPVQYAAQLTALQTLCEQWRDSAHNKARALAVELLNDWEAIFQVLNNPAWPLTNNEAERALRHWVMLRKTSYGTRNDRSSRTFALLASVIDTCHKRGHSPWPYLRTAIRDRRAGLPLAPLPAPIQGV